MGRNNFPGKNQKWPTLAQLPVPAKALVSVVILTMAFAMLGALGQIIVHDIIPTFWGEKKSMISMSDDRGKDKSTRGDIFSTIPAKKKTKSFYETDEFIFALKFTHIHIFGMSAIFILMGLIVLFLDMGVKARIWLIILPFIGVIIDLLSVWLKIFIHPSFFWLHIPGGILFGAVFVIDTILIIWQMWSYQVIRDN